jgi:hypothetical protein
MTRKSVKWAWLPVLSLVLGCGDSVEAPKIGETVTCEGTVLMDGKPLAGAIVFFHPKVVKDGYMGASGVTDESGKYILETDLGNKKVKKGVVPGKYDVTVSRMVNGKGEAVKFDPNVPPMQDPSVREQVPLKYSGINEMGLYYEVPSSGGKYDIEIPSKAD